MTVMNAKRRVAGNLLIFLGGLMLLASAGAKLAHVPKVVSEFGALGFDEGRLMFVALLEVASALLFVIPFTRSAGLPLVSSFLGGAIATHLQHAQSIAGPSVVLVLLWFGAWMRHPEVQWSWRRAASAGQTRVHPQRIAERA